MRNSPNAVILKCYSRSREISSYISSLFTLNFATKTTNCLLFQDKVTFSFSCKVQHLLDRSRRQFFQIKYVVWKGRNEMKIKADRATVVHCVSLSVYNKRSLCLCLSFYVLYSTCSLHLSLQLCLSISLFFS